MYFIGIDVSTKESALCILDSNGKIVRETKLPSDPEIIARFITDTGLAIERIGLESGFLRITVDWDTSQADDFRRRGEPWKTK